MLSPSFKKVPRSLMRSLQVSLLLSGLPSRPSCEEPPCQCRRHRRCGFDPWVGKIPWRRKRQPLQYSCLENPMDRGAWWATVHGVAKRRTRLSTHAHTRWLMLSILGTPSRVAAQVQSLPPSSHGRRPSISILAFSSYKDTVIELGSALNHRTGTSLVVQCPWLHVPVSFLVRELDPTCHKEGFTSCN